LAGPVFGFLSFGAGLISFAVFDAVVAARVAIKIGKFPPKDDS